MTLEVENPLGSLAPCRCLARLPTSTFEKIAPKIAVPKEPPMDRKNRRPEVATPSSEHGRVLHDEHEYLHHATEAHAEHEHVQRCDEQALPAPIRDKSRSPMVIRPVPTIGKTR